MKLTTSGTIKIDGHLVRFTDDGQWMVSRNETVIGYADSLAEVETLIATHRDRVRAKLADVERRAADRENNLASLDRAASRI